MNLLYDAAATVKRNGSFTEEWATFRNVYFGQEYFQSFPGRNDMQKLNAWATNQGLLLQFVFESAGFSTSIKSVTLLPKP